MLASEVRSELERVFGAEEVGKATSGHLLLKDADLAAAAQAGASLQYGELLFDAAARLFEDVKVNGSILELGSGTGKVAFQAFLSTSARRVVAVELGPSRFAASVEALKTLADGRPYLRYAESPGKACCFDNGRCLELRQGDFLEPGFLEPELLATVDLAMMQVCLPTEAAGRTSTLLGSLRPGAKVFALADLALTAPGAPLTRGFFKGGRVNARWETSWAPRQGHTFYHFFCGKMSMNEPTDDAATDDARIIDDARTEALASLPQASDLPIIDINDDNDAPLSFDRGAAIEVAYAILPGVCDWYEGWALRRHGTGAYDVLYAEEGTLEENVAPTRIRAAGHPPQLLA